MISRCLTVFRAVISDLRMGMTNKHYSHSEQEWKVMLCFAASAGLTLLSLYSAFIASPAGLTQKFSLSSECSGGVRLCGCIIMCITAVQEVEGIVTQFVVLRIFHETSAISGALEGNLHHLANMCCRPIGHHHDAVC
jgi:hypothetical protein